jgi:hypothetical protein
LPWIITTRHKYTNNSLLEQTGARHGEAGQWQWLSSKEEPLHRPGLSQADELSVQEQLKSHMEGPAEVFLCQDRQEGGQHGAASSRCDDEGSSAPHAS